MRPGLYLNLQLTGDARKVLTHHPRRHSGSATPEKFDELIAHLHETYGDPASKVVIGHDIERLWQKSRFEESLAEHDSISCDLEHDEAREDYSRRSVTESPSDNQFPSDSQKDSRNDVLYVSCFCGSEPPVGTPDHENLGTGVSVSQGGERPEMKRDPCT